MKGQWWRGLGPQAISLLIVTAIALPSPLFGRSVTVDFMGGVNGTVKGVHVIKDFWFELSEDWSFTEPATLDLRLSHSPVLRRDLSNITLAMNGSPFHSFYLDKSNMSEALISVPVPARLLRGGMNVLTITVKMRSDLEDLCDDVHNPALWTVVHKDSRLIVRFEEREVVPDLEGFPRDYANPDLLYGEGERRVHGVIFFPQNPSPGEWEVLAGLTALLGHDIGLSRGEFLVTQGTQPEDRLVRSSHLLIVGGLDFVRHFTGGRWSLPLPLASVAQEPAGYLFEFVSPFNKNRRLLVATGRDDNALRLLAEHLKRPATIRSLKGPLAVFDKEPEGLTPPSEQPKAAFVVRLEDMKLSDMVMRGKFYHSVNFTLPNPYVGKVKDGAFLRLSMSHSELLLPQTSSLLIKVNGEPIKSIRLTKDTASRNTWDIKIPVAYLGARWLTFELEVFMDVGDPECYYYHPEMAWFALHNDTLLYLPVDQSQGETLANYPYLFLKWNRLEHVTLALLEPLTEVSLTAAVNALAYLGQSLRAPDYIDVRMGSVKTLKNEDLQGSDLLLIGPLGSLMSDPVFATILPKELTDQAQRTEVMNSSGFLFLAKNPLDKERPLVVITGRSDKEIALAAPYLYTPGKVEWLRGTLAMVPEDGELRVLVPPAGLEAVERFDPAKVRFEEKEGKLVPVVEVPKPTRPQTKYNLAYLVFFILTPVLVLLVILRLRALSKEGRGTER